MRSDDLREKVLSTLLSASMVLSLMPVQALAEELDLSDEVPDDALELVFEDDEEAQADEVLVSEEPLEDEADEAETEPFDEAEALDASDEAADVIADDSDEAEALVPMSEDEALLFPAATDWKTTLANNYTKAKQLANTSSFNGLCGVAVSYEIYAYGITTSREALGNGIDAASHFKNVSKTSGGYSVAYTSGSKTSGWTPFDNATGNGTTDGIYVVSYTSNSGSGVQYGHVSFLVIEGGTVYVTESYAYAGNAEGTGLSFSYSQFKTKWGVNYKNITGVARFYKDAPSDIVVKPNSNTVTNIEQRWYSLRPKGNKHKALDIDGGSLVNGGNLQVYDWSRTKSQLYDIRSSGVNGSYNLVPIAAYEAGTTRYLTVQYASLDSGTNVFQWEGNGSNSQRWYIEKNSDGTFSLRNIRSGLYLDIRDGKLDNGTNVRQNTGNGTNAQRFYIVSANAAIWKVNLSASEFTYTGKAIDPGLKAYATPASPDYQLEKDVDYSLSLSNNVNVGTATWTVNGLAGNPTKQSGTFKIVPASINSASVSSISQQTRTGNALTPKPSVTYNGMTLKEGTDYSLSYSNNTNAGTAKVEITGKGNFTGVRTVSFEIVNAQPKTKDISKATVSPIASQAYTGKALKPAVTVKDGSATLKEGTDYSVSYKGNTKVGTATVTVAGKGNYSGTKTATFKITAASISKATVSKIGEQKWTGKSVTPKPTVKLGSKTLVEGTDYALAYSSNIDPGKATITISGKGNYSGKVTATFTIGAKTGEWKKSGKRWWYSWDDGTYPAAEFVAIDGKTYYFDGSGWMLTGWQKIGGSWYWFASSGAMGTGWTKVSVKWYWLGATGKMATGWLDESGSRYYLASSGAMVTGWQKVSGKWYWFASSGAMGRSRWVDSYYVGKDGVMLTSTVTPDGYRVGADGKWDGKGKVTA